MKQVSDEEIKTFFSGLWDHNEKTKNERKDEAAEKILEAAKMMKDLANRMKKL